MAEASSKASSSSSSSSPSLAPASAALLADVDATGGGEAKGFSKGSHRNYSYYWSTVPGQITTVHSLLMLAAVCLATTMLCVSNDASQRLFSLVMCGIALVLLLLWLSACYRSCRKHRDRWHHQLSTSGSSSSSSAAGSQSGMLTTTCDSKAATGPAGKAGDIDTV